MTITKTTTGGDGTFNFTISGTSTTASITTVGGTGSATIHGLATTSTYTVTETTQTGWDQNSNTCTNVPIVAGNTATCAIANTKEGSITVYKEVNGPAAQQVSDTHGFTVTLNGSDSQTVAEGSPVHYTNLVPGTYTIAETPDANYDIDSYSTDANGAIDGAQIVVTAGNDSPITVTNKQRQGVLHVIKHVDNSHQLGTNVAGDFTLNVSATNATPSSFHGSEDGVDVYMDPGGFSVSEPDTLGYAEGQSGICSGTMTSSSTATCTVTNYGLDPSKAAITVFKVVPNDNGGGFTVQEFPLSVTPVATEQTPNPTPVSVTSGIPNTSFDPGAYVVSESNPGQLTGFTTTFSGDCDANGNLTVEANHAYTCTITNDDVAPSLTLTKTMNITHGGTATRDQWALSASSTENPSVGFSGNDEGNGVSSGADFQAGTYTLSEANGPDGYTASNWSCQGTGTWNADDSQHVTLGAGQSETCSVTNSDQLAHLTIVKHTDAASGDDTFNFTVQSTGETTQFSDSLSLNTTGSSDHAATSSVIDLPAGTFDVSEVNIPQGWNLAGISCVYDNQSIGNSDVVAGTEHITVGNGDNVTCTFTDTKQGTLIVKKVLINDNGGTAATSSFSFTLDGGETTTAFNTNGENDLVVQPGTYTVAETAASGYTTTYDNCTDVTVPEGGTATCTITNNDVAPSTPTTPPSGGGGGGGGPPIGLFGSIFGGGSVLGTSTEAGGQVLGTTTCSVPLITQIPMGQHYRNNPAQVMLLQNFLNGEMGSGLPVSGVFGSLTTAAVKAFQVKYWQDVLAPWVPHGLPSDHTPTGIVYKTTARMINNLYCAALNLPIPNLP